MSTYDLINEFDNLLGFSTRPLSIRFTTPNTQDTHPMAGWSKEEDNYYTVVRMVGINPEDVTVELEDYGIHVSGESTIFEEDYSQDLKLGVAKETLQNIAEVNYQVLNGMCKITLVMKEPEHRKVTVNRI